MERTDKFCIAQTWNSKLHVSIFTCLMLLASLLVMLTCSWEYVGFDIFTLGFSFCCVPVCKSANSDGWSAWVSAAGYSSVSLCHKQEFLHCSWYICKGNFSTDFTQSWNVFQQEEVTMVKEAFGSTALALHTGTCLRWRWQCWTGPEACSYFVLLPQQIQKGS